MENTSRPFIQLDRRFLSFEKSNDPESIAFESYLSEIKSKELGLGWAELLSKPLVVILGEAGSGKSKEFTEKAKELNANGNYAFYIPLDLLVSKNVDQVLKPDESKLLEKWKRSGKDGWFFLDSVDEAKLRHHTDFYTALDNFSSALTKELSTRTHIYLSSRISEWWKDTDSEEVQSRLSYNSLTDKSAAESLPLVVQLLPLDRQRIEKYVNQIGTKNPNIFFQALDDNFAWDYARRPFDVNLLVNYWKQYGKIGSLTELLKNLIKENLQPSVKDHGDKLSYRDAWEGAATLAATSIFCKMTSFKIPDDDSVTNGLNAYKCLPDSWTREELRILFSRPLFDSESYGTIRLHHRNIGEYLCAQWLEDRVKNGCPISTIENLLFVRNDGKTYLRKQLSAVVAWLCHGSTALNERIRILVLISSPEIHLRFGDPSQLPSDYKRKILLQLANRYRGRKRLWLDTSTETLARLACRSIIDDVSALIKDSSQPEDLRIEMLDLIKHGRLYACLIDVFELFENQSLSLQIKMAAVIAIRDIGKESDFRRLHKYAAKLSNIPNNICSVICQALYPSIIDGKELKELLSKTNPVPEFSVDLPYYLNSHLKEHLKIEDSGELLENLEKLGRTPPHIVGQNHKNGISQKYHWVSEVIPLVLSRLFKKANLSQVEIQQSVVALTFLRHSKVDVHSYHKEIDLDSFSLSQTDVRRAFFWNRIISYRASRNADPAVISELFDHYSDIKPNITDATWLLADLSSQDTLVDKMLVLKMLVDIVGVRDKRILRTIKSLPTYSKELRNEFVRILYLHYRNKVRRVWISQFQWKFGSKYWWNNRLRHYHLDPKLIMENWKYRLHSKNLSSGKEFNVLYNLSREADPTNSMSWAPRSWEGLNQKRGRIVSRAVQKGCKRFWLTYTPPLPYEPLFTSNSTFGIVVGLTGIQASMADRELQLDSMNSDVAEIVIRYGLRDLNGFPEWLKQVTHAHKVTANHILCECIKVDWKSQDNNTTSFGLLSRLKYSNDIVPDETLFNQTLQLLQIEDPKNIFVLQDVFSLLTKNQYLDELAKIAKVRIHSYGCDTPWFKVWMDLYLQVKASEALPILSAVLKTASNPVDLMVGLCARLKPDPHDMLPHISKPDYLQARHLKDFIPLIFQFVKPEDDTDFTAVHTIGAREDAQEFRGSILQSLATSEDPAADNILQGFLGNPFLKDRVDFIQYLLDIRKDRVGEFQSWTEEDIRNFHTAHETDPINDSDLFLLTLKRFSDIKLEVEESENSLRTELREEDIEMELRRWLARKLNERSRGRYVAPQEEEIDGKLRPDIRIEKPGISPVTIEMKWANRWSLDDLIVGLKDQLIGSYIKINGSHYGIYFIGMIGTKTKWKYKKTKKWVSYEQIIEILQSEANRLVKTQNIIKDLAVFGIDFRNK